jgi:HEAT repeat protein
LFSVLYFSIALPFSKAATAQFPNEEALAGFLGLFQGLSTAVAFLASLFIANRLFARFGIVNAILAFPAIYFVGFGAIMSVAAFPVIVAFRFAQMVWLSGIADSAYQVLFNVVPAERRDQVRAFIGGVPEQAGIVIAGAILVIGEQALQPQQLYLIGLIAAGLTLAVFWRIKGAYGRALADALRGGQPQLFISEEEPFGGFRRDAEAVRAAVAGISDPNPVLRRVSAEILGSLSVPEATRALVNTLQDPEASVRAASVRALVCARATPALLDIAACLRDPEPEVRVQAVEALRQLAGYAPGLSANLRPLFDDPDPLVRTRVALALLMASPPTPSPERTLRVSRSGEGVAEQGVRAEARALLRNMVVVGDLAARVSALKALGEWGDAEAFELVCMELEDRPAPPAVRRAAAIALARIDPVRAIQYLIRALDDEDRSVRSAVARALELIGSPALEPTLAALSNPALERGALLALQRLPAQSSANAVRAYAEASVRWALHYHDLQQAVQTEHTPGPAGEALQLLSDALRDKARYHGLNALHAVGLLRERDTVAVAMEGLRSRDAARRANALETLDTIGEPAIIKPLLRVWESGEPAASGDGAISKHLPRLLEDPDAWIRACAVLVARNSLSAEADHPLRVTLVRLAETDLDASVRATATLALNGDSLMDTLPTLSLMERILFLRRVPLFTDLSPADLKQVAGIASEQFFTNGDVIAEQGEPGEEMYIIVAGEVSVQMEEAEKARRKPGDVVGEMAIISQEPRIASLIAVGDVRTLCISRQQFEGLLRERPETSLAVMRVLCQRLKEAMN